MPRQKKYSSEEERKQAIKKSKTKYMINKEWKCPECENRNYTLAGKWCHLKTEKHYLNKYKSIHGHTHDEYDKIIQKKCRKPI